MLWDGQRPIPGSFETLYDLIVKKERKVYLMSNNAIYSREGFFDKIMSKFSEILSPEQFCEVQSKFSISQCYNAAYVLAEEMSGQVPNSAKVVYMGPPGVKQEL